MSDEEKRKTSRNYEVGYGKPPKRTQFKKNESGNIHGRPSGATSTKKRIKRMLDHPTPVKIGDEIKTLSTFEVGLARLGEKARKGDNTAIGRVIALAREIDKDEEAKAANAPAQERAPEALTDEEQAIALEFLLRQKALKEAF
ncbi:MAG: DUF5681 domain-containing protein [Terricaulis sp.]